MRETNLTGEHRADTTEKLPWMSKKGGCRKNPREAPRRQVNHRTRPRVGAEVVREWSAGRGRSAHRVLALDLDLLERGGGGGGGGHGGAVLESGGVDGRAAEQWSARGGGQEGGGGA